jgi:aspartate 4-decarboxylase
MHASDRRLERLDPFELKDKLIALARARRGRGTRDILNAGRGNPDWHAIEPREAFFELGRFAVAEARRAPPAAGLGGAPQKRGIARRLRAFLARQAPTAGTRFLSRALRFARDRLRCDSNALVHELVDGVCGDHYPEPVRMLPHAERVMRRFLEQELCAGRPGGGRLDLFAVEGASAGVCYLFDSLLANGLLRRGDRIAVAVPIFSPYLEIPRLDRYRFEVVRIDASERAKDGTQRRGDGSHTWQYPDAEIDKVADPSVKALVLVNPSNPPSVAMRPATLERLARIVRTRRPDLIVVTDDVYATFVEGFRSVFAALPRNTVGVYSFSKHFGCTGWRLGVIAIREDNVLDAALRRRSSGRRYASLLLEPRKLKFIDRLVADSRAIAFNHTAGLSTPQQVQMALLALFGLMTEGLRYKQLARRTLRERLRALYRGLGAKLPADPLRAGYYAELDLAAWAERTHGRAFVRFLKRHHHPIDLLAALARRASIVLMPGGSFGGPEWSFRVSLANLPAASYGRIGEHLAAATHGYVEEWRRAGRARDARRRR